MSFPCRPLARTAAPVLAAKDWRAEVEEGHNGGALFSSRRRWGLLEDPELEYYKDGCLAERERADDAENELERLREAMGAADDADLVALAAILRRRDELCAQAHGISSTGCCAPRPCSISPGRAQPKPAANPSSRGWRASSGGSTRRSDRPPDR